MQEYSDRLDFYLETWARWIRQGGLDNLTIKPQAFWASGSSDFDGMVDSMLNNLGSVVQSVVDELPTDEQNALSHEWLDCKWLYSQYDVVIFRARLNVKNALMRKGVWTD